MKAMIGWIVGLVIVLGGGYLIWQHMSASQAPAMQDQTTMDGSSGDTMNNGAGSMDGMSSSTDMNGMMGSSSDSMPSGADVNVQGTVNTQ